MPILFITFAKILKLRIMKHRIAMIFATLLACLGASADNYTSLWKQVTAAQEKELPQTEVSVLNKIIRQARNEKQYGHLLKAELMRVGARQSISPDSLPVDLQALRAEEEKARKQNARLAAVYQSVLGTAYNMLYDSRPAYRDSVDIARRYLQQSISDMPMLAKATTSGYEPALLKGIDSRYFDDDLLHVLAFNATGQLPQDSARVVYDRMAQFYEQQGNRIAACYCKLQSLKTTRENDTYSMKRSAYVNSLDQLMKQYEDLPVAGEVAIERYDVMSEADDTKNEEKMNFLNYALQRWGEWPRMNVLRNRQSQLTLPSFQVLLANDVVAPGKETMAVLLDVVNLNNISLTINRVNVNGDTKLDPSSKRDLAQLQKLIDASFQPISHEKQFVGLPAYQHSRDTLSIPGLPVGVYLLSFTTDNKSIHTEHCLLRVSGIRLLSQGLSDNKLRLIAVDATSGKPLQGVNIRLTTESYRGGKDIVNNVTTDEKGEALFSYQRRMPNLAYPTLATDKAGKDGYLSSYFAFYDGEYRYSNQARLFTDRKLYRPGQQVHVAALVYKDNGHGTAAVVANQKLTLKLRDANRKIIATKDTITDEFGMASATFQLPAGGVLTGNFSVFCESGSTFFHVEEYKRPTFEVKFDKMDQKYQDGDSVTVTGVARTYTGLPVQNAKVNYTVNRSQVLWWRYYNDVNGDKEVSGFTRTDSLGRFSIKALMQLPETDNPRARRYYNYVFKATVTDEAGESHDAETSLPLSNRPTVLTCDLPDKAVADSLKSFSFSYRNNAGQQIPGRVSYSIDGKHVADVNANERIDIKGRLASGAHTLKAICEQDTLEQKFIIFGLKDTKAPTQTHDWFFLSSENFPANGDPVYLQAGSSDDYLHVVYSIMAGKTVLEKGSADLSNGKLFTRRLSYKEEYGDGLHIALAWVKDGKTYSHQAQIRRPVRDRRLMLQWNTFRDRLTPGQQEEWTLSITKPDGTPAKASLLAVLYDKSLDQIYPHSWNFGIGYNFRIPATSISGQQSQQINLYGEQRWTALRERQLSFTQIDSQLFDDFMYPRDEMFVAGYGGPRKMLSRAATVNMMAKAPMMAKAESVLAEEQVKSTVDVQQASTADQITNTHHPSPTTLRENLNETAFFFPSLVADGKGQVKLRFTLPESVTTWRFMSLAHTTDLSYGQNDTTTVAKKAVMVQPNLPRFLRKGDSGRLSARISNTSETLQSGTALLQLINPEDNKVIYTEQQRFSVAKDQTTAVDFNITTQETWPEVLIVRIMAEGHGYSDGEQHYLPILSSDDMAMNTLTFTLNQPGQRQISLADLLPKGSKEQRLTLEYTDNPAWLMVQSLPLVSKTQDDNAVSQAVAYYANSIGRYLMKQRPDIEQTINAWRQEEGKETSMMSNLSKDQELKTLLVDETPWLMQARREEDQKQQLSEFFNQAGMQARIDRNLQRIRNLQNTDGSFSWWPGMRGSSWMTMMVTETLVRLNTLTGEQPETKSILQRAFRFLDFEISREVIELRKMQRSGVKNPQPSELALRYLYATALADRAKQPTSDMKYLVDLLMKQQPKFTIYGKANTAIILDYFGHSQRAAEYLKSIEEYTVYKEEMGRYFDTPRAAYSWQSYRIPQQVVAIEAWKRLRANDTTTVQQMQRWLLQEKRTQIWDTPINTANAIYAFLNGEMHRLNTTGRMAEFRLDGQRLSLPKATVGLGYVKLPIDKLNGRTLTIDKTSQGTSWGAVYGQFRQKSTEIKSASTGLTIRREVRTKGDLKVGDKVTVRLVITADRDYDFVQVQDKRAACLEPVDQVSGYRMGCYIAPKDNATCFYFDRMAKGTHVVDYEYYIDRAGDYQTGVATVQCAYSPEFYGREKAEGLKVRR